MDNNIRIMEKELRNFAKRNKNVTYTKGLLMTFLITGTISLSAWGAAAPGNYADYRPGYTISMMDGSQSYRLVSGKEGNTLEVVHTNPAAAGEASNNINIAGQASKFGDVQVMAQSAAQTGERGIKGIRKDIETSVSSIRKDFREFKSENDKLLKASRLELVKLMEQGDHVVKSPWSSWQYGVNYFHSTWGGVYKGRGDKSEKYAYEGKFKRGEWWDRNVSPDSSTYERVAVTDDPMSTSTKTRKDLGLIYGLVGSEPVPDLGVPIVIEPKINVKIPSIPNLNVNPVAASPAVSFSIPDVSTVVFTPTTLPKIEPSVFNPPLLDQVATGFSQDMNGTSFYLEPNVIINNAIGTANASGTTVTIEDDGFTVDGAFSYTGRKDNNSSSTTQNRSGKVSTSDPQVTGTVDGTWKFNESNPKPDNSGKTPLHKTSDVVNSNVQHNAYITYAANTRIGAPTSPQAVFSFTQYQQTDATEPGNRIATGDVNGDWILKNTTENPLRRNKNYSNTVRFISVNGTHVASFYDPVKVNFNGNLSLFGRSAFDTLAKNKNVTYNNNYNGWTHMTVAVEQQAASAKESIFTNNGIITLEKNAAKPAVNTSDDARGSFLIGFSAMIEDYGQYQPTAGNSINQNLYSNITFRPWASEMNNKGTINVNSVESIGVDFSEFSFEPTAGRINGSAVNPFKQAAWGNKGSLRIYMNTGDINVASTDPGNMSAARGSYGIRVPNIFNGGRRDKTVDTEGIYYDETIIDGGSGKVTLTGSHNVGVSISKKIGGSGTGANAANDTYAETQQTIPNNGPYRNKKYIVGSGAMSVYNYQTGKGANGSGIGGAGTDHGVDVAKILDNSGRDENDLIGNIYNLSIVVDGQENVGFLRNSDYMKNGAYGSYSVAALNLAQNDFNIKDTHVKSINFTPSTDGGVLFRTDRFGINLEKNLTGAEEVNPGNANAADGRYNIVMLANGSLNPADTVLPKVKNTGDVVIGAGGRNVIGLMAYNGGRAEVSGDLTITDSPSSIGLVVSGSNSVRSSSAESSGNIKVTGKGSAGVYNNAGTYEMTAGSIKADGVGTIAVYASADGGALADTRLGAGTVEAAGKGAVALYASGGSDIELNQTVLNIGNGGLLFYGAGAAGDDSQLYLTGNATANVNTGGIGFYVKSGSNSPLSSIRKAGSTGTLTLNMATGSTLIVAEGTGGNIGGELVSSLSSASGGAVTGINVVGTAGDYIPYKASRVHLTVDQNSDLDNPLDTYLKSEFSSSSITVNNGITVSGTGAITSPAALAAKAKVAIAQKNSTPGQPRNDVILTNNGTIDFTGAGMAGIVGEFTQIDNNGVIRTTGAGSNGIITTNGGIAANNGTIEIGNSGVGIAGINYLGVTDPAYTGGQPATGEGFIEIVHNGNITSVGTNGNTFGILGLDKDTSSSGTPVTAARASSITLGAGSSIDVSSVAGATGVYSEGVYRNGMASITDNGSKISLGANGVGIFSKGAEISALSGTIIAAGGATAQGIFTDSDVVSSKDITLSGDNSIGIHNYGVNAQYSANRGRNFVNISNGGAITLGNSANVNNPSIGIYTKFGNVNHSGIIAGGVNTLGILSEGNIGVNVDNGGAIVLGDGAVGIYKKEGAVTLGSNSVLTVGSGAVGVISDNGTAITNNSANINIGDSSFGFALLTNGTNTYSSGAGSKVNMGSSSVYLYNAGTGAADTYTEVYSAGNGNAAIYTTGGNTVNNYGNIDYRAGIGNVGGYAEAGSVINNYGTISVGKSTIDQGNEAYSIGMATIGGTVRNGLPGLPSSGTVNVTGEYGIGMFAQGSGSYAENNGTIDVSGVNAYGMYIDGNGASGVNNGIIRTSGTGNSAIGVAVLNQATFTNNGLIDINLDNSTGVYIKDAVIKNYGKINISGTGSMGVRSRSGKYEDASGNVSDVNAGNLGNAVTATNGAVDLVVESAFDPSVTKGNASILPSVDANGKVVIKAYINGEEVPLHDFSPGPSPAAQNYAFSNVGIYVDTLGRTSPINWVDGYNPMLENDLIIGTEITEQSTSKAIRVGSEIITPFINSGQQLPTMLNVRSAALTWVATPTVDPLTDLPVSVTMTKVPYTDFVSKSENAWNFADGLEQLYGVEGVGTREKSLFDKLNNIGQNEQVLLTQAYDEMMGHQYGNVQQRIYATGNALDKEFRHLKNDWRNPSKQNNKIKVFGMKEEYRTDTAGIIDYTSNAYGFAYVHEDETVKLGNSSGWYAGAVYSRFNFKDIGKSKENQTMLKAGIFKTMSPSKDHDGSLRWTIAGDIFGGINEMKRKFLVVDDIFSAYSRYHSYGAALKTDLGYDIRLSERTHLRPYGSLKLEYGRFEDIKEKNGEVRLEVDGNSYHSVKPEAGLEFRYIQPMAVRTSLSVGLTAAYETELGKVGDVDNRGRVRFTEADWFGIRGEKEDRRGNGKFDLNIGIDNTRFGVTVNAGYDTKGENVRGGIGFRAIY